MESKEAILKELDNLLETIATINKQLDELLTHLVAIQAMAEKIRYDIEKGA